MVFPIYDADARPIGLVGRRPDDRGVRWLKHQTREVPLSAKSWLYGIDKARHYIRQYRTIILVEGIFDYFAFYNLLHDQDKLVVVSTLGSYLTPEAAAILKGLDIEALYCRLRLGRTRQKRHRTDCGQIRRVGLLPWRSGGRSGPLRYVETGG
jgi:DNA primase